MVMWPTILRSIEPQENLLRPLNIAEISYKKIAEQTEQEIRAFAENEQGWKVAGISWLLSCLMVSFRLMMHIPIMDIHIRRSSNHLSCCSPALKARPENWSWSSICLPVDIHESNWLSKWIPFEILWVVHWQTDEWMIICVESIWLSDRVYIC